MTQTFDPTLTLYEPAAEPLWTEEESAELELRLYRLLQSQFCSQTQGDSASVRMEEAAELMESIRYTLDLYLRLHGWPRRALLTQNLPVLFRAAQELLLTQVEETRQLYQRARLMVKPFGNQSLMDTLNGIGRFFSGYNARFRAQQIPADIDYQLCHPIPDAIQGVQYIREYLSRLLIENQLVTRMNPERVRALLSRACPDYRDLLVNLYEPVAACTVGLSLLGGGETLLELLPEQGIQITHMLSLITPEEAKATLRAAAEAACGRLELNQPMASRYLADAAEALYPRLSSSETGFYGVFSIR